MDKKKIMLAGVLIVAMVLGFFSITAYAANAWYYGCEVTRVGPAGSSDKVMIELSNTSFGKKWFSVQPGREKEMLAVGLTAMTNGGTVTVYTDLEGSNVILNMYYNNQ